MLDYFSPVKYLRNRKPIPVFPHARGKDFPAFLIRARVPTSNSRSPKLPLVFL